MLIRVKLAVADNILIIIRI